MVEILGFGLNSEKIRIRTEINFEKFWDWHLFFETWDKGTFGDPTTKHSYIILCNCWSLDFNADINYCVSPGLIKTTLLVSVEQLNAY